MLIAAIIFLVIALLFGFRTVSDEGGPGSLLGASIFGFAAILAFAISLHWAIGSQQLSGYIYSSSDTRGFTTAHIRFSQNAGTDAQPEFCVKTNSTPGQAVQKYVGSGTKVKIDIPSYFYLANNPFACGTTNMTITEVK